MTHETQILSGEELEQLVVAARSRPDGAGARPDPARQRRARRVREMDFSRPSKFSPEAQRRFERAHQAFCRAASTQLGAELRTVIEFEVVDLDQLSWAAALARIPQPSIYALVETEPLGTTIMIGIELPLMVRMIDRLLGGTGDAKGSSSELTEIEAAIARRIFRTLVSPLSAIWEELLGVTLALREVELKVANVNIAPPSEPSLTMAIEVTSEGSPTTMSLTVPYRAIEGAMDRIAHAGFGASAPDPRLRERVQVAVSGASIDVRVEAAAVTLLLDEVLAMKAGDIVKLDTDVSDGVIVFAGTVPVHRARPGRSGSKRAVEILDRIGKAG